VAPKLINTTPNSFCFFVRVDSAAANVKKLLADSKFYRQMSAAAKKEAEKYEWSSRSKAFYRDIDKYVN
jgi:glycosyltransferase involved in cell wall biosynthesis